MKKGFTLLLALIVASIILVISFGVYGIIVREITLAGLGKESQLAFYAADTGAECALYWDFKPGIGPLSTTTSNTIKCLGNSQVVSFSSLIATFKLNFENSACARVVVDKTNSAVVKITSYGYNVDCDAVSPKKVERGVEVSY